MAWAASSGPEKHTVLARNNFLPDTEGLMGKGLASAKLDCLIDPPMNKGASLSPTSLRINSLVLSPVAMCDPTNSSWQKGPTPPSITSRPVYSLGQRKKKPQSQSGLNNEEQKAPAQCRTKGHSCTGSYPKPQNRILGAGPQDHYRDCRGMGVRMGAVERVHNKS